MNYHRWKPIKFLASLRIENKTNKHINKYIYEMLNVHRARFRCSVSRVNNSRCYRIVVNRLPFPLAPPLPSSDDESAGTCTPAYNTRPRAREGTKAPMMRYANLLVVVVVVIY